MIRLVLLGLVLAGCDAIAIGHGEFTHKANQENAIALIWHDVYGQSGNPPSVRWVDGNQLNCRRSDWPLESRGFMVAGVHCVDGFTWSSHVISVSWQQYRGSYANTALAHEMMHAAQFRNNDYDILHTGEVWMPLEACLDGTTSCGLVDTANQSLRSLGL